MLDLIVKSRFKKDYKKAIKQGKDIQLLDNIINMLLNEEELPKKHYDHQLVGNFYGRRECHILPDWLLIYFIEENILFLERLGSHSEIFTK